MTNPTKALLEKIEAATTSEEKYTILDEALQERWDDGYADGHDEGYNAGQENTEANKL